MCTGRIDLAFIHRAFMKGSDGVFIGGCWPGECHYVTEGNYDALGNTYLFRKLMERIGMNPERLRIEWLSAGEGIQFAEAMNDFAGKLKALGPLGGGEGTDADGLRLKLEAVGRLIPYIKLVERERLRVPDKSEEGYKKFFSSDEFDRLFNELIADELTTSQIISLLGEKPLSTVEISEILGLKPSEVSKQMNNSSRRGLVRYDEDRKRYALA